MLHQERETLLHLTPEKGDSDCIKLLLDLKANPNMKDGGGSVPLHLTSERGHLVCVKVLLESSADPDVKNRYEETPPHLAASKGHPDYIKHLTGFKSRSTCER